MIVLPYLLAIFIGIILFVHWNGYSPLRDVFSLVVAGLLGAGFFVIVSFADVFLFNGYHAFTFSCTVWLSVVIVGSYGLYKYRPILLQFPRFPKLRPFHFVIFFILITALILMIAFARQSPYGDWNGWSFWNFRTKFIISSSDHWKEVYAHSLQAKHPWFLPYWLIFCYTMGGMDFNLLALVNSIVSAFLILVVVMVSVYEQTSNKYAVIGAGCWLATIPYFIYHSVGQSADITMGLMIVVNMTWLLRYIKSPDRAKALSLGMLLGMMAFTKDEGIVSAFIMLLLMLFTRRKDVLGFFSSSLGTLIPWLILLLMVKMWMWQAPSGVNQIQWSHWWEFDRWRQILNYIVEGYKVNLIFFITNILVYFRFSKIRNESILIMINFLLLFMAFFFLLYVLVRSDLSWRLYTTHHRLVFEIYGLGVILLTSIFFNRWQH